MKRILGIAIALSLGLSAAAGAAEPQVKAADAWARATGPDTKVGMAFVTLTNPAAAADRLVGASSPAAGRVEFHRHVHADGAMKMQRQDAVELPPGTAVRFSPAGLHVMLDGLSARLVAGQSFPLTLTFANSAPVTVPVIVVAQGAAPPAPQAMPEHMPGQMMHGDHAHDPAMHEEHMKDPEHRAMHERMHGPAK